MLSSEEKKRYNRHLILEGFGEEAQLKLQKAKVLVIGAGGLGSPVLSYLTAVGVGKIGIVDNDIVEESNLQRQTLFTLDNLNKSKAYCAKEHLSKQNPYVDFEVYNVLFTSENALRIVKDYDIVVDGTDNFPTRYLINDVCVLTNKQNVHGSINEFTGQVAIFNAKLENGEYSANYRDLYPQPPKPEEVKNCSEAGVIGVLPGIIGSMQALEVIKLITGVGEALINQLLTYDTLSHSSQKLNFRKNKNNPLTGEQPTQTGLIDYQEFCGTKVNKTMKSVNVHELKALMDSDEKITVIDVREEYEYETANLGVELIPMNTVPDKHEKFKQEGKVIVHCRSGARSANVIGFLEQNFGYDNLYNLEGGIMAWAREIDMSMTVR